MPTVPYIITVVCLNQDGSRINSPTVTIINQRTKQKVTITGNSNGEANYDLNNIPAGYQDGDLITVRMTSLTDNNISASDTESVILKGQLEQDSQSFHQIAKARKVILYDKFGYPIDKINPLDVTLSEDISIGAVEIKDATTDTRAVVKSDGTNNALVVTQNTVPTTTVTATNLDIRDLTAASDSVNISTGINAIDIISAGADATANTFNELIIGGMTYVYNGTSWDRLRGTTSGLNVNDISAGTQTNDVKITLDGETVPVTQATASNLNAQVVGNIAHGFTDSGNPVKIGHMSISTSNPTSALHLRRTDSIADKSGRQVVILEHVRDLKTSNTTTITASTTETTILSAGGSGIFHDVTALTIANTSATGVRVDIRDATAGTVRLSLYVPATDTRGIVFQTPFTQTTSNNNWTMQSSASVSSLYVFIQAVKNV